MTNLLSFPRLKPAQQPVLQSPEQAIIAPNKPKRVKLLDGKVTLLKRPEYKKDNWHYEIPHKRGVERKTTKTADLEAASKIAIERYHEIAFRETKGMSAKPVTFREAAESYIASEEQRRKLGSSIKFANLDINTKIIRNHIIPCIGSKELGLVTNADIKAMHEARASSRKQGERIFGPRPPTPVSMSQHEYLVAKIYDHAREQGLITEVEVLRLKRTKAKLVRRASFTDGEMNAVLDHLADNVAKARDKVQKRVNTLMLLYVKFLKETACRPGDEPLSVRFCDVQDRSSDPTPKVLIRVNRGKRGPRTIMLRPTILDLIEDIRAQHEAPQPTDRLFVETERADDDRYNRMFRKSLKKLGLTRDPETQEPRSLYSIRHYAISSMIVKGVSLKFIEKNCGTSVQMLTRHYDHSMITQFEDELGKMP